jgi:hypothetical protein
LLGRLRAEGYINTEDRYNQLKKDDADLEPLRARPDFTKLLAGGR